MPSPISLRLSIAGGSVACTLCLASSQGCTGSEFSNTIAQDEAGTSTRASGTEPDEAAGSPNETVGDAAGSPVQPEETIEEPTELPDADATSCDACSPCNGLDAAGCPSPVEELPPPCSPTNNCAGLGLSLDPTALDCTSAPRQAAHCCRDVTLAPDPTTHTIFAGQGGGGISIELDSQSRPHVVFARLNAPPGHATQSPLGGWMVSSLPALGRSVDLDLDSNDRPHVSFVSPGMAPQSLGYAWQAASGEWQSEIPYPDSRFAVQSAIGLSNDDVPVMLFVEGSQLGFGWRNEGNWEREALWSSDGDASIDLKVDSDGHVHITWTSSGNLWHAERVNSEWEAPTVVAQGPIGSVANALALELGSTQQPRIAFRNDPEGTLYYAQFNGENWTTELVANNVAPQPHIGLAINGFDQPHIVHLSFVGNARVMQTTFKAAGEWTVEQLASTVPPFGRAGTTDAAVDAQGWPHFAYAIENNTVLYSTASCAD